MKKIIISVLFLAGLASAAKADFSLDRWQHYKDVNVPGSGLVRVALDDEVFAGSAGSLADLRLTDGANREVPYKLITAAGENQERVYNPSLINNSAVPGQYSTVILDLGERGVITNAVTVKTGSENFQRNVTVFGSDDRQTWNVLKSNAYIYDYTDRNGNIKTQNTTVNFPESVFQFLKIEISDTDNKPVKIDSVAVKQIKTIAGRQLKRNPKYEILASTDGKSTEVSVDLGASGIPTSRINLMTSDENFNRSVSVFSSNDRNPADWQLIGQGYIFRYNTPKFSGENSTVDVREADDRYLKIVIHNKDNSALRLLGVETYSIYREMIFQAPTGGNYKLFYGNDKARAPQYDLEKYLQYLDLSEARIATLGAGLNNPGFRPEQPPAKPLTERSPYVLPTALVAVSVGLLFLVYKFLKGSPVQ